MDNVLEEFIASSIAITANKKGEYMGSQLPSIGRIVHVMCNREIIPAIITHVHSVDVISASVFHKNGYLGMRERLNLVETFGQFSESEWMWPIQTPSEDQLVSSMEDAEANAAADAESTIGLDTEAQTPSEDILS